MADLYNSVPGQVVVLALPAGSTPGRINFDNNAFSPGGLVIITNFNSGESVNSQFNHALDNTIYFYAFGDKMGQLAIGGIGFNAAACGNNSESGVETVYDYYYNNRAVYNGSQPRQITVAVGQTIFYGYLLACNVQSSDPAVPYYQFTLSVAALPRG